MRELVTVTSEEIKLSPFTHTCIFSYPFMFYERKLPVPELRIQEELKPNSRLQKAQAPVESAM